MMSDICFVRLGAAPLFIEGSSDVFGGAEVRAFTFAIELAHNFGHGIAFAVRSTPGLPSRHKSGIKIHALANTRLRGTKKIVASLKQRFTARPVPFQQIEQIDAQSVACFGVHDPTASIVEACRISGRHSVLFLTSDEDIGALQGSARERRRQAQHHYAIANANLIIAQNEHQQTELASRFNKTSVLVRNPVDLEPQWPITTKPFRVLWVGRADYDSKRADVCLDIAAKCSEIQFDVVMNESPVFEELAAKATANVTIHKHIPFNKIESLFAASSVLLNTSKSEGFPNAFLQAAKYQKPIVAINVDPGNMLTTHACGLLAGSVAGAVKMLLETPESEWHRLGISGRKYLERFHEKEAQTRLLYEAITQSRNEWSVSRTGNDRRAA